MTVPVRRCLVCRRRTSKDRLVRLVLAGDAVVVDPRARRPGRGAYLCGSPDCLDRALDRDGLAIARALRRPPATVVVDTEDVRRDWTQARPPELDA